jgi:hypothetical protein
VPGALGLSGQPLGLLGVAFGDVHRVGAAALRHFLFGLRGLAPGLGRGRLLPQGCEIRLQRVPFAFQ